MCVILTNNKRDKLIDHKLPKIGVVSLRSCGFMLSGSDFRTHTDHVTVDCLGHPLSVLAHLQRTSLDKWAA